MSKYGISNYPWGGEYRPRAQAVLELSGGALHVKLTAWEQTIVAAESRVGGDVYKDSCLEFFFMPCPEADRRYINVESNALGVMHIGVGDGREGRTVLDALPEGVNPRVRIRAGEKWSVRYALPVDWIRSLFPKFDPGPGTVMLGNFYKCDESIHPHYGCWNPIETPEPDFHRPEHFGRIIL